MDKVDKYEKILLDYLKGYAKEMYGNDPSNIDTQIITDREGHHYQLLRIGWSGQKYVHYCPLHFDIKNGKVWIQINNTEEMIGDKLVERGIPKEDIVLGFHHEDLRKYTGFATA